MQYVFPNSISSIKEFCLNFLFILVQIFLQSELSLLFLSPLLFLLFLLPFRYFSLSIFRTRIWDGKIREEAQLAGDKDDGEIETRVCLGINLSKLCTYVGENKKGCRLDEASKGLKSTSKVTIA